MVNDIVLSVKDLTKFYYQANSKVAILKGINLDLAKGELIAIVGSSGSGKSTLLHIIGLLDASNSGAITIMDQSIAYLSLDQQAKLRSAYLGFVYQHHYLLQDFSVLENVMLPQLLNSYDKSFSRKRALELLSVLGLEYKQVSWPRDLSGGEAQRVAIARALANRPQILLADEPTGNLDTENATKVFELLLTLARNEQVATIIVTHDLNLAAKADRAYELHEGILRLHAINTPQLE